MLLLVQKLLAVVLPMDVQQAAAQRLQLAHRYRPSPHAADALTVTVDLPLQQQGAVLLRCHALLLRDGGVHTGEHRADKRLVRAGADEFAACPLAQHRAEGIDDNGFARAGLAGQRVEACLEPDVRLLDDGDIFNVEHFQHGATLLCRLPQHLLDLFAEIQRTHVVVEHQQDGVVTGQRAHDVRVAHVVQCEGGTLCHALDSFQHHQILGSLH